MDLAIRALPRGAGNITLLGSLLLAAGQSSNNQTYGIEIDEIGDALFPGSNFSAGGNINFPGEIQGESLCAWGSTGPSLLQTNRDGFKAVFDGTDVYLFARRVNNAWLPIIVGADYFELDLGPAASTTVLSSDGSSLNVGVNITLGGNLLTGNISYGPFTLPVPMDAYLTVYDKSNGTPYYIQVFGTQPS